MKFQPIDIEGAFLIKREPSCDERGYFSRLFCEHEFAEAGLDCRFVQMNVCSNKSYGTLRGMHFQKEGKAEDKLVSCLSGWVYDVCLDLRTNSPSYKQWAGFELSEENGCMLFIPKGCAHGYVTLERDCKLLYLMTEFYTSGYDAGYRYDDPAFGIIWPVQEGLILSEKDRTWPNFKNSEQEE